ncbi:MAG: hypothetical protein Q9215_007870, partial [Flavoplaca cf. flavocitrina]
RRESLYVSKATGKIIWIEPLKSTIVAATAPLHTSKTGARFGYFPALVMKSLCQSSSFDRPQFVRKTGFASISISNARHNKGRFLCEGHRPPSPKPHVYANT